MWGRKRPKQSHEETLAEARSSFAETLRVADESQAMVGRAFGAVDRMHREIEEMIGRGEGLPTKSVRARLAEQEALWDEFHRETVAYDDKRHPWRGRGVEDAELAQIAPYREYFVAYVESCVPVMEHLTELIGDLRELQASLTELSESLAPIRERTHAALAAAAHELAWAGPSAQGKFALEVRLNAVGDRLRELDAGLVDFSAGDSITAWYRDVETEIAEIRDAMPRSA
ncbi:hypothetical protein ACFY41_27965 [Streptomyces syringium]|uniref:hypothetical protein n=1 Tax=Streptomyces syringium TaxID=76729 RepID=UPI00369E4F18